MKEEETKKEVREISVCEISVGDISIIKNNMIYEHVDNIYIICEKDKYMTDDIMTNIFFFQDDIMKFKKVNEKQYLYEIKKQNIEMIIYIIFK
jgi:hypothetical protein